MIPAPDWSPTREAYHAEPWSSSAVKLFNMCRFAAHWRYVLGLPNPLQKETSAMRVGTAGHRIMLEPELAAKTIRKSEKSGDRRNFPGFDTLTDAEFWQVWGAVASVWGAVEWPDQPKPLAITARELLTAEGGRSEWPGRWRDTETGVPCRFLADRLVPQGDVVIMPDIKIVRDASPRAFSKQATELDYWLSFAHYRRGASICLDRPLEHIYPLWIVIGSRPAPGGSRHHVTIYSPLDKDGMPKPRLMDAERRLSASMVEIAECLDGTTPWAPRLQPWEIAGEGWPEL